MAIFSTDTTSDTMSELAETGETVKITIGSEGVKMADEQAEPDLFALSLTGKKKKKKRKAFQPVVAEAEPHVIEGARGTQSSEVEAEPAPAEAAPAPEAEAAPAPVPDEGWQPYEYTAMLELIYEKMRKRESSGYARGGDGVKRFVVRPPQVMRLGTKKSGFANFCETAESLGRDQSHLQRFLEVELGTTSRLDGAEILVLKGKFGRGEIEKVLRGYIRQYVRCPTCEGHSTRIERDRATRLNFMVCNECSARASMAEVEQGFRALTEKRSRIRRREGK